ncbi:Frmpd3p [Dermatophagoides farinae]|nr:Frmpd3p [Dermatophagoides farinae]
MPTTNNQSQRQHQQQQQPKRYHQIRESKKSCFQTKEMEEIFIQCQYDIDMLLARLEEVHEHRISSNNNDNISPSSSSSSSTITTTTTTTATGGKPLMIGSLTAKETLLVESRHFITASKLFVKCATEGSLQLIDYLTECVGLLERMFIISEDILLGDTTTIIQSPAQITCLVDRLKEVAATYAYTVDVVRRLVNHNPPYHDQNDDHDDNNNNNNDNDNDNDNENDQITKNPYLDLLMTHATGLSTSLSTLMRTLRTMN